MKKKSFSFRNALAYVIVFFGVVSCSNDKDILEITEKAPPMKSIEKVPCTRSIDEAKTIAANFWGNQPWAMLADQTLNVSKRNHVFKYFLKIVFLTR